MNYVAYKIPQGEGHPMISGLEQLRYAENYYFCTVPDISTISSGLLQKYGIIECNEQVIRGLEYFVSTKDSAKLYKNYSSGQADEFFDEDFDTQRGIRIKRPMSDDEVFDRYEAIRWVRIQMVRDYYKQKFTTLQINKTPQEQATWDVQLSEAKAYLADNTVETPTLTLLANARGTNVEELATLVISASSNYNTQISEMFAEEETYVTQLKNAQGDDIINVDLPVQRTIIPGDTRFDAVPVSGS
jgi:hypothetical protein